jgi:hypothetical protein
MELDLVDANLTIVLKDPLDIALAIGEGKQTTAVEVAVRKHYCLAKVDEFVQNDYHCDAAHNLAVGYNN